MVFPTYVYVYIFDRCVCIYVYFIFSISTGRSVKKLLKYQHLQKRILDKIFLPIHALNWVPEKTKTCLKIQKKIFLKIHLQISEKKIYFQNPHLYIFDENIFSEIHSCEKSLHSNTSQKNIPETPRLPMDLIKNNEKWKIHTLNPKIPKKYKIKNINMKKIFMKIHTFNWTHKKIFSKFHAFNGNSEKLIPKNTTLIRFRKK